MTREMTPAEQRAATIAGLKSLKRHVDAALKEAEGAYRDKLLTSYAQDGTDRAAIVVGGRKVGSLTEVPAKWQLEILPGREDEALAFLRERGLTREVPVDNWRARFEIVEGECFDPETGEVCEAIEDTPVRAPFLRSSGFKDDDVRQALQAVGFAPMDVLALTEGSE